MNIIETIVSVGIKSPFRVVHISDTHLTDADLRDGERKVLLAEKRKKIFPGAEQTLERACQMAREQGIPILHTGDLLDFVSIANLEKAKEFTDKNDCFMAAGNHEFSLYVGEAKEDAAYRNQSLAIVQTAFKNNIRMSSRVIGDVNFVALDNGYYLFDVDQLAFLKAEVSKQMPIVLLLHNPLYERALYDVIMKKSPCAYLVGVPEALMQGYPADRLEQQRADDVTREAVAYIQREPKIKAIIAGHIHFNYEGVFANRIPQITTSCTDIRHIEFV